MFGCACRERARLVSFCALSQMSTRTPIKTLPEGTIVTVVGEDSVQPDRVWKRVRDPEGAEGWAAADYLAPVTP